MKTTFQNRSLRQSTKPASSDSVPSKCNQHQNKHTQLLFGMFSA
jgi:hypothetical protein